MRRAVAAALLIVAPAAALVLLVRIGADPRWSIDWSDPGGWLARSAPEDAVVAVLRLAGIGLCAWLVAGTALGLVARRRPRGATGRLARRVAGRHLTRVIERVLALSIVAGTTLGPALPGGAGSSTPPPTVEVDVDVRTGRADSVPSAPSIEPATPAPPPAPAPARPSDPAAPDEHVVVAGESLWSIAAGAVAVATGRPASVVTDAEIAEYWIEILATNRDRLASGDPNLIYPGEVVLLPR